MAEKAASAQFSQVPCAFCKGKGVDPFEILSKLSKCQVCGGRGKVTVKTPYEKCPACKGTGIFVTHRLPCAVCGGRGAVEKVQGRERCEKCKGDGIEIETGLPCTTCYRLGML